MPLTEYTTKYRIFFGFDQLFIRVSTTCLTLSLFHDNAYTLEGCLPVASSMLKIGWLMILPVVFLQELTAQDWRRVFVWPTYKLCFR